MMRAAIAAVTGLLIVHLMGDGKGKAIKEAVLRVGYMDCGVRRTTGREGRRSETMLVPLGIIVDDLSQIKLIVVVQGKLWLWQVNQLVLNKYLRRK